MNYLSPWSVQEWESLKINSDRAPVCRNPSVELALHLISFCDATNVLLSRLPQQRVNFHPSEIQTILQIPS